MAQMAFSDIIAIASIIVSVFFGISAWFYSKWSLAEAKKQNELALKEANEELKKSSEALETAQNEIDELRMSIPNDIEIIPNVHDALERLNKIIRKQGVKNGKVDIQIFGLDLQTVMPWFMTKIIQDDFFNDIHVSFRCMLINPNINIVKPLINEHSNISKDAINNSIKNAHTIDRLPDIDRLNFEMRQYNFFPIIHGYLVDHEFLGLAFTQIENNKIYGGRYPYICCQNNNISKFKTHLFGLFDSWFEFYWLNSKIVAKSVK